MPSLRVNDVTYRRLHDHGSRIFLPRSSEERREALLDRPEIGGGSDSGFLDNDSGVLVWVGPTLSRDHVFLTRVWSTRVNVTVLENGSGVSEDEIDGAGNETVDVELTVGMDVESVLIS